MREHSLFRYPNNLKTYKPKTYEKNKSFSNYFKIYIMKILTLSFLFRHLSQLLGEGIVNLTLIVKSDGL